MTSTRGGQDPDTEPGHRVQGRGQDKDKWRTRPGHRAGPQGPAIEFSAASVASSFFSKIKPQQ